ncbi:hypothetical protein CR205_04065 [Alteribacter lacisalsi]|uniref:Putative phosphoesterase CR205_04065 n=1 Tax=Alteribacter lacisalsi TaxID=2045244 RepID=A0A2W0HAF1_9BACI|nr:YjcG family protein [Alteribacter lacisalsi]PYZ97776.1 hypothetical protein CR205_04065 [Alteribacter lacisalsi]
MKYGIAIFPSKKLQDIANSYRKRYDSHYSLIPPHVTIKEAFTAEEDELPEILEEIQSVAGTVDPFTMEVYKFGSFHPVTNTIYMKVRENETLSALRNRLNSGKLEHHYDYQFVPHITIGQELDNDECSDVFGRLKMETVNHEEKVDRISLLYQLDNNMWTVYETFRLGIGE